VTCNCITETNHELKKQFNVVLDTALQFSFKGGRCSEVLRLPTRPVDGTRPKKGVPIIVPAYCPFCGKSMCNKKSTQNEKKK
jgi:hypothetical protein